MVQRGFASPKSVTLRELLPLRVRKAFESRHSSSEPVISGIASRMPTRPSKEPLRNRAAEEALRRIEEARKSNASTLDLSRLKLSTLPEAIGHLSQLQGLSLDFNQLSTLPEAIGRLSQLQGLYLPGNQLSTLPEAIGQLSKLQKLDLSGNQLSTLPEAIGQPFQLQELDLSGNQLSTLPEAIGQLSQLRKLSLGRNQLSTLPETIGQLSQLQELDLSGNQLSTLPEAIGQLSNLQELSLPGNQLRTLPEVIGQLSKLRKLSLSYNSLSALPETIGQLSQLQELYLAGNELSALPEALQSLVKLEKLFLHGNPGLGLPDEVLGPTVEEFLGSQRRRSPKPSREILDYYFATRGATGRALREVKLIVVGRGGAGKTSLIKRLKGEPFDPREGETHGINIRELVLVCTDGPVQARVWDFGGQHVLYAMHEFFLTARSLYLLVLGERDDMAERDAAYWLQLIRSYAGPAPVVVALNKSDGG